MKIRIDDDFDNSDLEKFNLNNKIDDANMNEDTDLSRTEIIETTFKEVTKEKKTINYDNEYKEYYKNYHNSDKNKEFDSNEGKITIISQLENNNKTLISSAKINLYILNGVSPKLIESKLTDNYGKVTFEKLKKGSYRVIAIVDRKYFEKPSYTPWNEVNIDTNNKETTIVVNNKIKSVK